MAATRETTATDTVLLTASFEDKTLKGPKPVWVKRLGRLTDGETAAIDLMRKGLSPPQISARLSVADDTVIKDLTRALDKLGVVTLANLARLLHDPLAFAPTLADYGRELNALHRLLTYADDLKAQAEQARRPGGLYAVRSIEMRSPLIVAIELTATTATAVLMILWRIKGVGNVDTAISCARAEDREASARAAFNEAVYVERRRLVTEGKVNAFAVVLDGEPLPATIRISQASEDPGTAEWQPLPALEDGQTV
jgi:DNA-binding CsgD family transcriptional regulator